MGILAVFPMSFEIYLSHFRIVTQRWWLQSARLSMRYSFKTPQQRPPCQTRSKAFMNPMKLWKNFWCSKYFSTNTLEYKSSWILLFSCTLPWSETCLFLQTDLFCLVYLPVENHLWGDLAGVTYQANRSVVLAESCVVSEASATVSSPLVKTVGSYREKPVENAACDGLG